MTRFGLAATLLNMGLTGRLDLLFICAIGGDINGPVMAGLLTVAGLGAVGKHPPNVTPVVLGLVLGSLTQPWVLSDPAVQPTALFATNLAPVAGSLLAIPFHGV